MWDQYEKNGSKMEQIKYMKIIFIIQFICLFLVNKEIMHTPHCPMSTNRRWACISLNSTTQACHTHGTIVAFLATMGIKHTTLCLQGVHANHLTKSLDHQPRY